MAARRAISSFHLIELTEGFLPANMKLMTEAERTRLIGEIATVLKSSKIPAEARQAGLTLIGWLARRMPQDKAPRKDR